MDHNAIDTTSLKNVLIRLPIFLSSKSVHVMAPEEAIKILLLSAKYHAEAAGYIFIFEKKKINFCLNPCLQEAQNRARIQNLLTWDYMAP